MDIPLLFPEIFHKQLDSGVTKPSLLSCRNSNNGILSEYVVKLKSNVSLNVTSLLCELIASKIANVLCIPTPEPALIEVSQDFALSIQNEEIAKNFNDSIGLNFGTKFMAGFTTWTNGMSITSLQTQLACEILAFDALIQNPDRSLVHNKPNVLTSGEQIIVIDHEKAFSFLIPIIGSKKTEPWEISEEYFIKNHLFYGNLKKHSAKKIEIDFELIENKYRNLNNGKLEEIFELIPEAWNCEAIEIINNHLNKVLNNLDKFVFELKKVLV